MRKQCQAHVSAKGTQCQKRALVGSRYCYLHHSWGATVVGSVVLLIAGAVLSPIAQQAWDFCFPSPSAKLLQRLTEDQLRLELLVNNEKLPTNCLLQVPAANELVSFEATGNHIVRLASSGQLTIKALNSGKHPAERLMLHFYAPSVLSNFIDASTWHPQPGFTGLQNGILTNNPNWLHSVHLADFPIPSGSFFSGPQITIKGISGVSGFPIVVAASTKDGNEIRMGASLSWASAGSP